VSLRGKGGETARVYGVINPKLFTGYKENPIIQKEGSSGWIL
jgi:hypothetical protein